MSEVDLKVDQLGPPDAVTRAVRLMWVGAGLEPVAGGVAALSHSHSPSVLLSGLLTGAVVGAIWWLVARTCLRGRPVGRVLASVFFGFNTVGLLQTVSGEFHVPAGAVVVNILNWIVGLGAVLLLWTRDSSEYFQRQR